MAHAVTELVDIRIASERRKLRRHLGALWVAVIVVAVLAVAL